MRRQNNISLDAEGVHEDNIAEIYAALANVSDTPRVDEHKYSSDSSVYTDQSIINPNSNELLYCIASIIQSEIFEQLGDSAEAEVEYPELVMYTSLAPHLGGPLLFLPSDLLDRETIGDPELREQILAGTVPTVDTILRFISWIHQSAKYTAQCNVIAFIYIKRIIATHHLLSANTWRAVWLGAVVLAQKFIDDVSVRTSSFCSILPGVTKSHLKAVEIKMFALMDFSGRVKPSLYAKFYFELGTIFQLITGQLVAARSAGAPLLKPLTRAQGVALYAEPPVPSRSRGSTVQAVVPPPGLATADAALGASAIAAAGADVAPAPAAGVHHQPSGTKAHEGKGGRKRDLAQGGAAAVATSKPAGCRKRAASVNDIVAIVSRSIFTIN